MKLRAQLICMQNPKHPITDPELCSSSTIAQTSLSLLLTYCKFATGLTSLFFIPYLCNLSDRIGRKKVLVIIHISLFVSVFIVYTNWKLQKTLNYHFLIIGAVFEGVANPIVVMNLLSAYVSDCIMHNHRTKALAQIFCGTTLGYILGPILGSQVYERTGHNIIAPYTVCLTLIGISTISVLWVFPESINPKVQELAIYRYKWEEDAYSRQTTTGVKNFAKKIARTIKSAIVKPYQDIFDILKRCKSNTDRTNLTNVVIIDVLFAILSYGIDAITINYLMYKLKVTVSQLGIVIAVSAILRVVSLGLSPHVGDFLGWVSGATKNQKDGSNNKMRVQDVYVMRLANIIETFGLICLGISGDSTRCAFLGICLIGLGVMSRPNVLAAMINVCPHGDIGRFMGAKGPLEILVAVFGASFLLWVYGQLVACGGESSVFFLAAAMYSVTIWISFRIEP